MLDALAGLVAVMITPDHECDFGEEYDPDRGDTTRRIDNYQQYEIRRCRVMITAKRTCRRRRETVVDAL